MPIPPEPVFEPQAQPPAGPPAPDRRRQLARRRCLLELTLVGLGLAVYMASQQPLGIMVSYMILAVNPGLFASEWAIQILNWILSYLLCPGLMALVLHWVGTRDIPHRPQAEMHPGRMLRYCVIAYGCSIAFNYITLLFTAFLARQGSEVSDALSESLDATNSMPLLALSLVLMAPVAEELIFRHLLLRRLRKYGDGFSLVASAFAFSLCHANIPQMLYAFALGMLLGYVVLRYGHVVYAILIHAFHNFMGFMATGLARMGRDRSLYLFTIFAFFLTVIGVIWGVAGLRRISFTRTALPLGKRYTYLAFFFNPGTLLFVAVVLYYIGTINFR